MATGVTPLSTSMAEVAAPLPSPGFSSPRLGRSRGQSLSSDRPSVGGQAFVLPPTIVSPEASFIAASAASQIITNDQDSHAEAWLDQHGLEPAEEPAQVSEGALILVNSFLDQLLFNILQVSKATTLKALRPAVTEVLKPKLAKDAIENADDELQEYLGGADEEEYVQPQTGKPLRDWDVELVWKRTRLRCMVYSSLGDMEEEDEDEYMQLENLEVGAENQVSDVISPAVAIFLTSVLEYMGELTLTVAGQAAYHRMRAKFEKEVKDGVRDHSALADRVVVEDVDMERVALDRTLGRLWRGWKKKLRSPPVEPGFRSFPSRNGSLHGRNESINSETWTDAKRGQDQTEEPISEDIHPHDIPLPLGLRDVDEIEVPGLVVHSDDEDGEDEDVPDKWRPRSLYVPAGTAFSRALPDNSDDVEELVAMRRIRSNSLPSSRSRTISTWLTEIPAEDTEGDTSGAEPLESAPATEEKLVQVNEGDALVPDIPQRAGGSKRNSRSITREITEAEANEDQDETIIERAEVMISARVSRTSDPSPPQSDVESTRRSSSIGSVRMIDVPAPRSATSSRPSSLEPPAREKSTAQTKATPVPVDEEKPLPEVPGVREVVPQVPVISASRSPVDRVRTSLKHPSTISESEEEVESIGSGRAISTPDNSAQLSYSPKPQTTGAGRYEFSSSAANRKLSPRIASREEAVVEEPVPKVPMKAPGHAARHAPKPQVESIGIVSIDRQHSREVDEVRPQPSHPSPRQLRTSESSGSSVTGRHKAFRTSEDSPGSRSDDMAKNFEDLIQSNQTITYTLTPEISRDEYSIDSPVLPRFPRKFDDYRGPARGNDARGSGPFGKSGPTSSHPVFDAGTSRTSNANGSASPKSPRFSLGQGRDARSPLESTSATSELAKSTGPAGVNRPLPFRDTANGMTGGTSPVSRASSSKLSIETKPIRNSTSRQQPKAATTSERSGSSDLVDFLRQGPPDGANERQVSRQTAPLRSTMDSDSTNVTETTLPSVQSSANSHTALLKSRINGQLPGTPGSGPGTIPKRTIHRGRDPYAIDLSDEDNDELAALPKQTSAAKEESLAEFLASYNPPAAAPSSTSSSPQQRAPKKKSSATSLLARLRGFQSRDQTGLKADRSMTDLRSSSRGSGSPSGHIPIQVKMPPGYNEYGLPDDNATRNQSKAYAVTGGSKPPMKKFEPREATSASSHHTAELAAFFRDSAPPASRNVGSPVASSTSGRR